MSKFRIKLKLHPSEEAGNNPPLSAASTSQATQAHAADETGEATSDAGGADVSMATSNAADSEDELASEDEDDTGSNAPSSSAADGIAGQHLQRSLGSSSSRIASPSLVAPVKGKRKPTIRDEVGHMTAEELDALPPAKRRKGAKARGAPGPGRGWRKGLKMGQKPIYALPDTTPIAEGTPATLASDFHRSSPASALSPSPMRSTSAVIAPSASGSKVTKIGSTSTAATAPVAAPSGQALMQRQQAIPGRPSQAVAAALGFGPPVKQPPRLINTAGTTSNATTAGVEGLIADPNQKPRRWYYEERQLVNLGGRVVNVKTWWGGKNESFDPISDREREEAARAQAASDYAKGRSGHDADDSRGGSPMTSKTSTPRPSANSVLQAASAALSASNNASSLRGAPEQASRGAATAASRPSTGSTGFFSPSLTRKVSSGFSTDQQGSPTPATASPSANGHLPKPKFQPGTGSIADWKASSVGKPAPSGRK